MIRTEGKAPTSRQPGLGAFASASLLVLLAACGAKHEGATQVVARVNDDEITVHEVNFLMQQQHNVQPNQVDAVNHQIVEHLIDQQLAVQKAIDAKLDRDPQTMQTLEAARREILARRYVQGEVQKTPAPTDADVQKYFQNNPALFSERKVYSLQRVDVQAPAERRAEIGARVASARSASEITDWLTAQGLQFGSSSVTIPAEGLPLQMVAQVAALKEGQSFIMQQPQRLSILTVLSFQTSPKTLEDARQAITQFLAADAQRNAVAAVEKNLRQGAKIEYKGQYAASAPAAGDAAASEAAPAPVAPAGPKSDVPAIASSGIDPATLQRGMGLK